MLTVREDAPSSKEDPAIVSSSWKFIPQLAAVAVMTINIPLATAVPVVIVGLEVKVMALPFEIVLHTTR